MTARLGISYGRDVIQLNIPSARLAFDLQPADMDAVADGETEILRALAEPIGTDPLADLVSPGQRVCVMGDDATRITPTDVITPLVLDELNAGGVSDDDIVLVIATGTHRAITAEELVAKYGKVVTDRVEVLNHDCMDADNLTFCGKTSRGTEIWVSKTVLNADIRVGIGNIVPHHPTGWSGGAKILLPGVASRLTTGQMHLLGAAEQLLGETDTPCRQEMEDFAASVGLDFIVNTVLDRNGQLIRAVAGHYIRAHRQGVTWGRKVFGSAFTDRADITLSSCYPTDLDLFQADKGLFSAARCTTPGGEILLISPCTEGVSPTHPEAIELSCLNDAELWRLAEEGNDHDPLSVAEALYFNTIKRDYRATLVTEGISAGLAMKMGFGCIQPGELPGYIQARLADEPGKTVGILRNSVETLPVHKAKGDRPNEVV